MPAEQILPGLYRVGGGSWNGTVATLSADMDANVYVLAGRRAVLVDCGTVGGRSAVEANLESAGVRPQDLRELLLTHSHFDHTQAASLWQAEHELHTHLNARGARYLARGDHRLVGHQMHGPEFPFRAFHVDHAVDDGETFDLGERPATARHLPGHTPDSTLYTFRHDGLTVGICGDIAFGPTALGTHAVGLLSTLWQSDLDRYVDSLIALARIPIDLLLPGHGAPVRGRAAVREAVTATLATARALARNSAVRINVGV